MSLLDEVIKRLEAVSGPDAEGWFTARCPFHSPDRTPSLRIKIDTGVFVCMSTGCGRKGPLSELARAVGIPLDAKPRDRLTDANAIARLTSERLVSDKTVGHFKIKPDLRRQAWAYPVVGGTRFKAYYSHPPHEACDCPECKAWKKYWHTRGTPHQLYGLSDIPRGTKEIWFVNGEPSVWQCFQSGLPAICSIFGEGKLPDGAGALLKNLGISKVNIVFDLDETGYKGALLIKKALQEYMAISIRELPAELGIHADIGDLFVKLKGDEAAFAAAMAGLKESFYQPSEEGVQYVPGFRLEDGTVGEMVIDRYSGERSFYIREGISGQIVRKAEFEPKPGVKYLPMPGKLPGTVVFFADHPEDYGDLHSLFEEIRQYIHDYVDVTDEYEQVAALYVMLTWVYDALPVVPYLRFLGNYGTGKTTFLMVLGLVSFRGTFANGATSTSPVFRVLDAYQGSLMLDEMDWKDTSEWAEIIKILNCGNAPGMPVLRSEPAGDTKRWEPACYRVFSPKAIATRRRFTDEALETRCLTQMMRQKSRELLEFPPLDRPPSEVQILRNKLLKFRLDNLWDCIRNLNLLQYRDNNISPRLSQIISPLKWLSRNDGALLSIIEEFGRRVDQILIANRSDTMEAAIVDALVQMHNNAEKPMLKTIAENVEEILPESDKKITPRKVGWIIKNRLHLETKRLGGSGAYYAFYDDAALVDLSARFGIPPPITADSAADEPEEAKSGEVTGAAPGAPGADMPKGLEDLMEGW